VSVAVPLEELQRQAEEFGPAPFLVTVGPDGHAHVTSVRARIADDHVAAEVGRTSSANVAANPAVTLLWPPVDGGPYGLIVDGSATVDDDSVVTIRPTRAVLHRLAGAPDDVPGCVEVDVPATD
jgi:hypothetical protein